MFDQNVPRVLGLIGPHDTVLDIGGWARPFNRANWVIDHQPYPTRGYYGAPRLAQGGEHEYFTDATWIRRDICDRVPYPFTDKSIDFVICSHTLEDVRDPLWVCSEMMRIGRRGYIEVPSRIVESCRGIEAGVVGWSHHRWLVDITESGITFQMKYHMIHAHWRFSLPASFHRRLMEREQVQWLLWEGHFDCSETIIQSLEGIAHELEAFVARTRPYPSWLMSLDRNWRGLRSTGNRIARGVQRRIRG